MIHQRVTRVASADVKNPGLTLNYQTYLFMFSIYVKDG